MTHIFRSKTLAACVLAASLAVGIQPSLAQTPSWEIELTRLLVRGDAPALSERLHRPGTGAMERQVISGALNIYHARETEGLGQLDAALKGDLPDGLRLEVLELAGGGELSLGLYEAAAGRFREALAVPGLAEDEKRALEQSLSTAVALTGVPRVTIGGDAVGHIDLDRDLAGLLVGPTGLGGADLTFVYDTGADLSVIAERHAESMGLIRRPGSISVNTPQSEAVDAYLAVAPELTLGGKTFQHVPFIVLPDASLTFAGGAYRIEGIIGWPVLSALGEVTIRTTAGREALDFSPSRAEGSPNNLLTIGLSPRVLVDLPALGTSDVLFALDSGANAVSLRPHLIDRVGRDRFNLTQSTQRRAAAGSDFVEEQIDIVPTLTLSIAGVDVPLENVSVYEEASAAFSEGRLGQTLWAGRLIRFDRAAGRFELLPETAP